MQRPLFGGINIGVRPVRSFVWFFRYSTAISSGYDDTLHDDRGRSQSWESVHAPTTCAMLTVWALLFQKCTQCVTVTIAVVYVRQMHSVEMGVHYASPHACLIHYTYLTMRVVRQDLPRSWSGTILW